MNNYLGVTELAGDDVTMEQLDRLCNRYYWAGKYCAGKDVVEVACGTGQGLGYIGSLSKSLKAGDCSEEMISVAERCYKGRYEIRVYDAHNLPYETGSVDVILIFEAIYYLQDLDKFLNEVKRVLRSNGKLLIATANKDLSDFNPSPYSVKYYGVAELFDLLSRRHHFNVEFYGYLSVKRGISLKQKILRPIKKAVVLLGLMPKTMAGKKLLKRLVFGSLVKMPMEISVDMTNFIEPDVISNIEPNKEYKVIYCAAYKD